MIDIAETKLTWSVNEIAEATTLSKNYIRKEIKAGKIKAQRFGRRILVSTDEIKRYLKTGSPGKKGDEA